MKHFVCDAERFEGIYTWYTDNSDNHVNHLILIDHEDNSVSVRNNVHDLELDGYFSDMSAFEPTEVSKEVFDILAAEINGETYIFSTTKERIKFEELIYIDDENHIEYAILIDVNNRLAIFDKKENSTYRLSNREEFDDYYSGTISKFVYDLFIKIIRKHNFQIIDVRKKEI